MDKHKSLLMDKIMETIRNHEKGFLDDEQIGKILGKQGHEIAYICEELRNEGLVELTSVTLSGSKYRKNQYLVQLTNKGNYFIDDPNDSFEIRFNKAQRKNRFTITKTAFIVINALLILLFSYLSIENKQENKKLRDRIKMYEEKYTISSALRTSSDLDLSTIDTLELTKSISNDLLLFKIGKEELKYKIDFSDLDNVTFELNSEQQSFFFDDSISIFLNTEKITIFKFKSSSEVIDGEILHFFTKNHGLLMYKSSTWGNSTILELWSYPILEPLNIFQSNSSDQTDSELEDNLIIETTENER